MYAVAAVLAVALSSRLPHLLVLLVLAPALVAAIARYIELALVALIPLALVGSQVLSGSENLALPALVIGVWLIGVTVKRWPIVPWAHGTVLFMAATIAVSALNANSPAGRIGMIDLLIGLGLLTVAISIRPNVQLVLVGVGTSGLLASLAIVTGAFGTGDTTIDALDAGSRVTTLGLNPNYLAMILALGAVAWLGIAAERRNPLIALLALPVVIALPATRSREGLLLLLVGAAIAALAGRGIKAPLAIIALAVVLLLVFPTLPATIYGWTLGVRATAQLQDSDTTRAAVARYAAEQGFTHPIIGIGYNNFAAAAAADRSVSLDQNTHNDYLRLFAEVGLPCLIAWITLLLVGLRNAFTTTPRAGFAVLVTYAVLLAVGNALAAPGVSRGPLVLLGVCIGASSTARTASRSLSLKTPIVPVA